MGSPPSLISFSQEHTQIANATDIINFVIFILLIFKIMQPTYNKYRISIIRLSIQYTTIAYLKNIVYNKIHKWLTQDNSGDHNAI